MTFSMWLAGFTWEGACSGHRCGRLLHDWVFVHCRECLGEQTSLNIGKKLLRKNINDKLRIIKPWVTNQCGSQLPCSIIYESNTIQVLFCIICLMALRFQLFIAFTERKKKYYSVWLYRKWGTHAQMFSQTLVHENSKEWNKIKKQTKKVRREAWVWKEAKRARKIRSPDRLSHPNQNIKIVNIIL